MKKICVRSFYHRTSKEKIHTYTITERNHNFSTIDTNIKSKGILYTSTGIDKKTTPSSDANYEKLLSDDHIEICLGYISLLKIK